MDIKQIYKKFTIISKKNIDFLKVLYYTIIATENVMAFI